MAVFRARAKSAGVKFPRDTLDGRRIGRLARRLLAPSIARLGMTPESDPPRAKDGSGKSPLSPEMERIDDAIRLLATPEMSAAIRDAVREASDEGSEF